MYNIKARFPEELTLRSGILNFAVDGLIYITDIYNTWLIVYHLSIYKVEKWTESLGITFEIKNIEPRLLASIILRNKTKYE